MAQDMSHRDLRAREWLHGRYLEKRLTAWQHRRRDVLRQLERDFCATTLPDPEEARAAIDVAFHLVDELRNYALCVEAQAGELSERLRQWEAEQTQPG